MSKKHVQTVPTPILPAYPCPKCGATRWARYPLIDGRECVCVQCYPVRTWSPISDEEYQQYCHVSAWKLKLRQLEKEAA